MVVEWDTVHNPIRAQKRLKELDFKYAEVDITYEEFLEELKNCTDIKEKYLLQFS